MEGWKEWLNVLSSFRFFDGFCEFSNKVAIPESKCLFGNRDGRATRTAQQHLLGLRVRHFPVSLISQDGRNADGTPQSMVY